MPDVRALDIRDLRFRYPGVPVGAWTVDVPALSLDPDDQMLLTGGSGCGKSTLLQLVAGLLDPAHGSIQVAGQRIDTMNPHQRDLFRGRHIGNIFQTFNLLPGFTAMENVMLAMLFSDIPPREHEDRARHWLNQLGVEQHQSSPERLSVGQQQRVAVARALVCDPALVLADEPTASLDPENARLAIDLIQEACAAAGAALLCVSHDPSMVDRFKRHERFADLRKHTASPTAGGSA